MGGGLAAEDGRHAVEAEQPHRAPVQGTDDDQRQRDAIEYFHIYMTSIRLRLLLTVAFPREVEDMHKKFF